MRTTLITVALVAIALLGGIVMGYHHGYTRGSSDELSRWKIQSVNNEPFPDTTMIGKRELWVYSDGSRVPTARTVRGVFDKNVNNIPVTVSP